MGITRVLELELVGLDLYAGLTLRDGLVDDVGILLGGIVEGDIPPIEGTDITIAPLGE